MKAFALLKSQFFNLLMYKINWKLSNLPGQKLYQSVII